MKPFQQDVKNYLNMFNMKMERRLFIGALERAEELAKTRNPSHGAGNTRAGMIVEIVGAPVTARGKAQLIFGLKPDDPATFVEIGLIFLGAAVLSCMGAARRAVSVDPVVTLRTG